VLVYYDVFPRESGVQIGRLACVLEGPFQGRVVAIQEYIVANSCIHNEAMVSNYRRKGLHSEARFSKAQIGHEMDIACQIIYDLEVFESKLSSL